MIPIFELNTLFCIHHHTKYISVVKIKLERRRKSKVPISFMLPPYYILLFALLPILCIILLRFWTNDGTLHKVI
jgi:hypothetical protein